MNGVSIPRGPDALAGRILVPMQYVGWEVLWSLMPQRWQARSCAKALLQTYHAAGYPAQGVAFRLPGGSWWTVSAKGEVQRAG